VNGDVRAVGSDVVEARCGCRHGRHNRGDVALDGEKPMRNREGRCGAVPCRGGVPTIPSAELGLGGDVGEDVVAHVPVSGVRDARLLDADCHVASDAVQGVVHHLELVQRAISKRGVVPVE